MKTGITPFLLTALSIPAILLGSQQANAQNEGRWYDVEMIVFKRLDSNVLTEEFWPSDLKLAYPEEAQYLFEKPDKVVSPGEQALTSNNELIALETNEPGANPGPVSFQLLPKDKRQLGRYRNSLGRNPGYRVLFHEAWQQQMQGKADAPAIVISGGDIAGDNRELEGFIKLYIARFLHINTDLWLSHEQIAQVQNIDPLQNPSQLPEPPLTRGKEQARGKREIDAGTSSLSGQANKFNNLSNNNFQQEFTEAGVEDSTEIKTAGVVVLKQHRRLRSKELHYIDHPLMGLIIYFSPIDLETGNETR